MNNKKQYLAGLKDGTPIALGYFAVGFTLGIAAKAVGINAAQAGLMSFLMHASAGEFAVLTVIAGQSGYLAMIITQLVINIRYFLMSCSMSQKINPNTSLPKRLLLSYFVTDEIFGITIRWAQQQSHLPAGSSAPFSALLSEISFRLALQAL